MGDRPSVSEEQRDRVVTHLSEAYAQGKLDEASFEDRVGKALTAETPAELRATLRGVAGVAATRAALSPTPSGSSAVPSLMERAQNVGAGLTHLSGLCTSAIGPGVVAAMSQPGSRIHREATQAVRWQMIMLLVMILTATWNSLGGPWWPILLAFVTWLFGTMLQGVRALQGESRVARQVRDAGQRTALGQR